MASNQVMLRVRFAEVSRSALQELGVNLFTADRLQGLDRAHDDAAVRRADLRHDDGRQAPAGARSFSDFLNIFVFNNKHNIGAVIRALQRRVSSRAWPSRT